jgi:hypothetical protein
MSGFIDFAEVKTRCSVEQAAKGRLTENVVPA